MFRAILVEMCAQILAVAAQQLRMLLTIHVPLLLVSLHLLLKMPLHVGSLPNCLLVMVKVIQESRVQLIAMQHLNTHSFACSSKENT